MDELVPTIKIPRPFAPILERQYRYFVFYGGRGGAKSHTIARILLAMGMEKPLRIACCREIMTSVEASVHQLLRDLIGEYGLSGFYRVYKDGITGQNGTKFIFRGLKHNIDGVRSMEGVDICWVEEANNVSDASWEITIPTIRKPGSFFIVSFNPKYSSDPTYRRFIARTSPDTLVTRIGYRDNPFFPVELEAERVKLQREDPEAYAHVWEGEVDNRKTGFIYAKQLARARDEQRITNVPYDPAFPVYTAWDLGFGDATSVWFFQMVGREVRVIDHATGYGEEMDYYVREVLGKKRYRYAPVSVYLPHDGAHGNIRGATPSRQMHDMGYRNVVLPKTSNRTADIEMTRQVMSYTVWDATKCEKGLYALEHYRYEWNEERQQFKTTPLHDWASNDADAFRALAGAVSQLKFVPVAGRTPRQLPMPHRPASWMGA